MAGLHIDRAAEIIVTLPDGRSRRGSGYLVSTGRVLTAAHVIADATVLRVRFDADRPTERTVEAVADWAHPGTDVAVLAIPSPNSAREPLTPSAFGQVGERDVELRCSAIGFPRYKLRHGTDGMLYRDSAHVQATCTVLSNRREGTLDLTVTPPAMLPEPQSSPWEGMSGAAVFSSGRIIGVIAKHHLTDGPGRLAASRVDRWAQTLSPDECSRLETALGCSLSLDALPDVAPPSSPAWKILDRYAEMLRDNTGRGLTDTQGHLELDRINARQALGQRLAQTGACQGTLVVLGEPDVGKSALALRTVDDLQQAGATVAAVSLRDLPPTVAALEADLGRPLAEVLQEAESTTVRLLVIDGAEAVLEDHRRLLTDLAVAALRAGFGVAAVTRTDAARAVLDSLQQANDAASPAAARPEQHEVPQLTDVEKEKLTQAFPSVARFGQQSRAAWLLGRPGLVDLLLRADATQVLPDGALSEADVFAAVWSQLVRDGERTTPGRPSPDAREQAMAALARRRLLSASTAVEAPDPAALPSLRSDGLLLPAGPNRAWRPFDDFASDLVRDLAVAHLLLKDGWELLEAAGAPRWALRAVRLACQATLANAGRDSESARMELQQVFDPISVDHGDRWAELPLEAILTLGSASEALTAAWPALTHEEGQPDKLAMLLRLVLDGHSRNGIGDPVILAPMVQLTHSTGLYPDQHGSIHTSPGIPALVWKLVLAWLRGLVAAGSAALPLRQQVRDALLAVDPERHDENAVEAIAMLGADLDGRAEAFLRGLAEEGGGFLAPAVESEHTARSMARTHPGLLLLLTEAYYIEKPRTDDPWYSHPDPLDEGVRGHTKTLGVFGPMAGWDFGPFSWLLRAKPIETLQMIHRLLDHAASTRVGRRGKSSSFGADSDEPFRGVELDLPGGGRQLYIGDEHVWSWYRGTSVGPYPCMSALLSVELFADHLVDKLGLPISEVTELLMRGCRNLAMPGLIVGMLVRHPNSAGTELDRWLAQPGIWHLESIRAVAELNPHAQGADSSDTVGGDRRRLTFLEVAEQTTGTALLTGNLDRLTVLHEVGDELLRRGSDTVFGSRATSGTLSMIKGWASRLYAQNYHLVELDDGRTGVQYVPPPEVVTGLAPENAEHARNQQAIRLLVTYAKNEDRSAPLDTLTADLELARSLAADPPEQVLPQPMDPMAATAAAAMVAHADGFIDIARDDIAWAANLLLDTALHPNVNEYSVMSSLHSMGADRSAAIGVPLLLLETFDAAPFDRDSVQQALFRLSTSLFDEVRCALPLGLARVWSAPCNTNLEPGTSRSALARAWSALRSTGPKQDGCRHQIAWTAVEAGLSDCRLGPWNQQLQRRPIEPLGGPPAKALREVGADQLLVNRLTGPIMAATDAAHSGSCVASRARHLLNALWEAHRKGSARWAMEGYSQATFRKCHRRVIRVLMGAAAEGNFSPLAAHLREFTSNAPALAQLLHDLSLLCTYDAELRRTLPHVWPTVMQTVLDAIESGVDPRQHPYQGRNAVAALIPHPTLDMADSEPSASLNTARGEWINPENLSPLIARWMNVAGTTHESVDALIDLIETAPRSWQATTGLQWVDDLIGDRYKAVASRSWRLPGWLEILRSSSELEPSGRALIQRLIDGLATNGDARAVKIQRLDE
ncbi:trypsin-like peptidase domain-containing protein [Streptomyces sp. ISL-43]|uniref:trypsin-like peptidase domain-containing protein n=1 Tax=Streptomyces sp. ISL-43 TaxID=2819183 RepID=UPI001BE72234|nr:trypsin-like peptidase domain-containing protein [Streptomyces sp. ISL-43]MBT2452504.1 trypsin-like peptidase domain-containing protein [Streptomyces sp. ISL-43]